ncbi:MAG: acyl-CoA dehydrogenase, partial [Sphingorhabdus sp.]|nr:acyl-CoA dehydrogenase [Sphingorhabdus sp.]
MNHEISAEARNLAEKVESFVRNKIFAYEKDVRCEDHGPTDELVQEMRALA